MVPKATKLSNNYAISMIELE